MRRSIYIDNKSSKVEVIADFATVPVTMSKGLKFRQHLAENAGMLFVFGSEALHEMWMKDTLIPLDLVFIDGVGEIVDIRQGVPGMIDKIRPMRLCKYVLEVNAGFCRQHLIKVGNKVKI